MTRWNHARKGIIEGTIVWESEDSDWVHIELSAKAKVVDWPDPFRYGIWPVYADKDCIIKVRKSLLTELEIDDGTERDN